MFVLIYAEPAGTDITCAGEGLLGQILPCNLTNARWGGHRDVRSCQPDLCFDTKEVCNG